MLRFGSRLKPNRVVRGIPALKCQNGANFSSSASGNAGRSLLIGGGVALLGGAAVVGRVWQSPEFRKSVEQTVPATHYLFDPFLGKLDEPSVVLKPLKKDSRDPFEYSRLKVKKGQEQTELSEIKESESVPIKETATESVPIKETITESVGTGGDVAVNEKEVVVEEAVESNENGTPELVLPAVPTEEMSPNVGETILSDDKETAFGVTEKIEPSPTISEKENSIKAEESVGTDAAEAQTQKLPERTPEEVEEALEKLEEDVLADAAATSAIIEEVLSSCAQRCMVAIERNTEAAEAISLHTSVLRAAMDDSKDDAEEKKEQWTDVSRILEQKSRLQDEAESAYQDAREELVKLKSVMDQAKSMKNLENEEFLIEAEENWSAMNKEVEEKRTEVHVKLSESHVMAQYKDLVETAKEQFRNELLSVMPDVKLEPGWRSLSRKLSQDDLNALIAHAHRRVDQLQRELAEERVTSTRRMEMAVRVAREKWEEKKQNEIARKIEQLRQETEIEHDKKMNDARITFESEMRVQLKRQAAAHSEHLADMLGIQEKQIKETMNEEFQRKLEEQEHQFCERLDDIKSRYENDIFELSEMFQFNLNKALSQVAGIESAVDGRSHIENASRKSQELWLACEALRISLQYGDNGKPIPLQSELDAITQIHSIDAGIEKVAMTFPEEASKRGVFTEEALRISYQQVSKMCRRLSLVSEESNSLFIYFLSYLKSFLIISRAQNKPPADLNAEELDTFRILSYATYCLDRGDLEQAARFMNQLKGEPKRVAEGWLKEARLLLETKQTVQALSTLASAISIAANLEI